MIPFLNGTLLFFSASPNFEANLLREIFNCHKYLKIPIDTLWEMPIRERRAYIQMHNRDTQSEQDGNRTSTSTDIDRFTDIDQANIKNRYGR